MFYKKGDKVRLENNLIIGEQYGRIMFTPQLAKLSGKILTINSVTEDRFYIIEDEGNYHKVCIKMIKSVPIFKKGDKVRVRCNLIVGNNYRDAVFKESMKSFSGKIVTIKNVWTIFHRPVYEIEESPFICRVDNNNVSVVDLSKSNLWSEEMFKVLVNKTVKPENNSFTKTNLKDGMVVEFNSGDRGMILNATIIGMRDYKDLYADLNNYNDHLEHNEDKDFYIKKIYKSKSKNLWAYLDKSNLELIWERKEEKPNYYTGKVICLNTRGFCRYTQGKIYNINNGILIDDVGNEVNFNHPVRSFEDFKNWSALEWFEIKE